MKRSQIQMESLAQDGLRFIDEDGIDYYSEEENAEIIQKMADENINHLAELTIDRYFLQEEYNQRQRFLILTNQW